MSLIDRLPQEVASNIWSQWLNVALAREFNMHFEDELDAYNSNDVLSQIKRVCKAIGLPWDGLDPPSTVQRVKYTHPIGLSFHSYPGSTLPDIRVTSRPPPIESNACRLLHMDGLCLEASFEQIERALSRAAAPQTFTSYSSVIHPPT
jgi:hypothetical protein